MKDTLATTLQTYLGTCRDLGEIQSEELNNLEKTKVFGAVVAAADEACLSVHLEARGALAAEYSDLETASGIDLTFGTGTPDSLRNEMRCFLRRSGAYLSNFRGHYPEANTLADQFVRECARKEISVVHVIPVEGLESRPDAADISFGEARFWWHDSSEKTELLEQHASRSRSFPGAGLPEQIEYLSCVVVPDSKTPADLLGMVGSLDIGSLDFQVSSRGQRFLDGHGVDIECALNPLRLFEWDCHLSMGLSKVFWPPKLDVCYRIHDGLLWRPFEFRGVPQLSLQPIHDIDGELVGFGPVRWLQLRDGHGLADHLQNFARALDGIENEEWVFMQSALGFLRKAESSKGYDQFIALMTSVEAAIGEDGQGLTTKLKNRWGVLLGHDAKTRTKARKRFDVLYQLRSRYLHGDDCSETPEEQALLDLNKGVRAMLSFLVRWLDSLGGAGGVPTRRALLSLLDLAYKRDVENALRDAKSMVILLEGLNGPFNPKVFT